MKAKTNERERARELRTQGKSLNEIVSEIGVAKSSVSCWVRDIELTLRQKTVLRAKASNSASAANASKVHVKKYLDKRKEYQERGRKDAKKGDLLHCQICMLYWAEGKKDRCAATMGNTDPNVLKLFVEGLKSFYKIEKPSFNLRIRAYVNNGVSEDKIVDFWTNKLSLDRSSVRKVVFDGDKRVRSGKKKNIHPYGICEVSVFNTELVQRIYGSIQEYAGFSNGDWIK